MFKLVSKFKPSGDQPEAIKELVEGIKEGKKEQVLLDIYNCECNQRSK